MQQGIRTFVLAAFTAVLISCTYVSGIQRGMDRGLAAEACGRFQYAAAIAISNQVYGLGGWATHIQTFCDLSTAGITTDAKVLAAMGSSYPANLSNPDLIDSALASVASKPKPSLESPQPIAWDDLGYSDYVGLSFRLFGYHISGPYKLFFILVFISAAICLAAGRDQAALRLVPPVFVMALFVMLRSGLFADPIGGLYSVSNPRFLSVLAYLPAIHLLLLMLDRRAPTRYQVALAVPQAAILVLACHIRASSWWAPIGVVACWASITLVRDARPLLKRPVFSSDNRERVVHQGWPAGVMVGMLLLFKLYVTVTLHPVYKGAGAVGAHAFWHSVVYSIQYHPEMYTLFPEWTKTKYTAGGDEVPFAAATVYMNSLPGDARAARFGAKGPDTPAKWEIVFRAVALQIALSHPLFMAETFLIYKPKLLWSQVEWYFRNVSTGAAGIAFLFLCQLACAAALIGGSSRRDAAMVILACALAVPCAFIPVWMTVPNYNVMADGLLACTALGSAVLLLVPLALLGRC